MSDGSHRCNKGRQGCKRERIVNVRENTSSFDLHAFLKPSLGGVKRGEILPKIHGKGFEEPDRFCVWWVNHLRGLLVISSP